MRPIKKLIRILILLILCLIYVLATPIALIIQWALNDISLGEAFGEIKEYLHSEYLDYVNKYLKDWKWKLNTSN